MLDGSKNVSLSLSRNMKWVKLTLLEAAAIKTALEDSLYDEELEIIEEALNHPVEEELPSE